MTPLPTPEELRTMFRYDRETGVLTWATRDRNLSGKVAGGVDPSSGYRRVRINGSVPRLVHRVIWAMETGEWPEEIDHINGNRSDNRMVNLRSVTRGENMMNKSRYKNNKTGIVGIFWHKQHRKWCASVQGKTIGVFANIGDAVVARNTALSDLSFHQNHGRSR